MKHEEKNMGKTYGKVLSPLFWAELCFSKIYVLKIWYPVPQNVTIYVEIDPLKIKVKWDHMGGP